MSAERIMMIQIFYLDLEQALSSQHYPSSRVRTAPQRWDARQQARKV